MSQPSPLSTKGSWRIWAKQHRAEVLTPDLSQVLISHCVEWLAFQQADELLITWPTANELDVRPLTQAFQGSVYLPKVLGPQRMAFHRFESEATLIEGPHNLLEPANDSPKWQHSPDNRVLLIAPALCVDIAGYRLGYGGGYFDCWLKAHRSMAQGQLTVASLVPQGLVVDALPHDDWDQPVDYVITEDGTAYHG